jgi:hypothetical protein
MDRSTNMATTTVAMMPMLHEASIINPSCIARWLMTSTRPQACHLPTVVAADRSSVDVSRGGGQALRVAPGDDDVAVPTKAGGHRWPRMVAPLRSRSRSGVARLHRRHRLLPRPMPAERRDALNRRDPRQAARHRPGHRRDRFFLASLKSNSSRATSENFRPSLVRAPSARPESASFDAGSMPGSPMLASGSFGAVIAVHLPYAPPPAVDRLATGRSIHGLRCWFAVRHAFHNGTASFTIRPASRADYRPERRTAFLRRQPTCPERT